MNDDIISSTIELVQFEEVKDYIHLGVLISNEYEERKK